MMKSVCLTVFLAALILTALPGCRTANVENYHFSVGGMDELRSYLSVEEPQAGPPFRVCLIDGCVYVQQVSCSAIHSEEGTIHWRDISDGIKVSVKDTKIQQLIKIEDLTPQWQYITGLANGSPPETPLRPTVAPHNLGQVRKTPAPVPELNGLITKLHADLMAAKKQYPILESYTDVNLGNANGWLYISYLPKQKKSTMGQKPKSLGVCYVPIGFRHPSPKQRAPNLFAPQAACYFPTLNSRMWGRVSVGDEVREFIVKRVLHYSTELQKQIKESGGASE